MCSRAGDTSQPRDDLRHVVFAQREDLQAVSVGGDYRLEDVLYLLSTEVNTAEVDSEP